MCLTEFIVAEDQVEPYRLYFFSFTLQSYFNSQL